MTPVTGRSTIAVLAPWLLTAGLFTAVAGGAVAATLNPDFGMDAETAAFLTLVSTWAVVQSTVGTAIAWRRPDNLVGRLMQATGPLIIAVFGGFLVGALRYLTHGPTDLIGGLAAWLASAGIYPMIFLALPALGILFPDGHLPGPRFRAPVIGVTLIVAAASVVGAVAKGPINEGLPDNPFGLVVLPPGFVALANVGGALAEVVALVLAVAGVIVRWRRGSSLERAQLKWLLAALSLAALTFGPSWGSGATEVWDLASILSGMLVPVAIGVAVLRYRLYEIDRLISRTLSWALVSAILGASFIAGVVAMQAVLSSVTQGQTLAVAVSTLVAAALFQPVRRRVQGAVDRRFDRARYDAERTVDGFAGHLRSRVDLDAVEAVLVATAMEAVRPTGSAVWVRRPEAPR